jgi:hypothetical protein
MKTLEDVIDFVENHEWTQGTSYNSRTGAYCLTGAIQTIAGFDFVTKSNGKYDDYLYQNLLSQVRRKIAKHTGGNPEFTSVIFFNDDPDMTKEKVLEVLRA